MQQTYFKYLEDFSADNLLNFWKDLLVAGVYTGCDVSIRQTTDNIHVEMTKGKYILTDGLIVEETDKVTIGNLVEVSSSSWQIKTIIAYGPQQGTLQRSTVRYDIVNGLESNESQKDSVYPYAILGWIRKTANDQWEVIPAPKVTVKTVEPLTHQMQVPFPTDKPLDIVNVPKLGIRQGIKSNENKVTFKVILGNTLPLHKVKCNIINVPKSISIKINLLGSDSEEPSLAFQNITIADNSKIPAEFEVDRLDCRHAALEFEFKLAESTGSQMLNAIIESIYYELDPSQL